MSWAVLAVLAGLEGALFHWFEPAPGLSAVFAGVGLVCLLLWPPVFARFAATDAAARALADEVAAARAARVADLHKDFSELAFPQGLAQLEVLDRKVDAATAVLERRLRHGEVTYHRYLGMIRQVYLATLDNLQEVAVTLRAQVGVDADHVAGRLAELQRQPPSPERDREVEALERRRDLMSGSRRDIAALMAQNESAMTILDHTATALAATRTERGSAGIDAETAMRELEELANRTRQYAVRG